MASAELEFDAGHNLIYGANGAGKTSILEAVAYLWRARAFRAAGNRELVRHGQEDFVLFGRAVAENREVTLGVRNGRSGLDIHMNGEKNQSVASLAEALPLQVVDPDVHNLVAGGPEGRRRYIDWIAFHVEQGYLEGWRRFRRALKQRNAALRETTARGTLTGWNEELSNLGIAVDATRRRMIDIVGPMFEEFGKTLLRSPVSFEYLQGWSANKTLHEALADAIDRDLQFAGTQVGPHRADLKVNVEDRRARKLVSRGQQKLLACAMILAATKVVQTHIEKPLLLLLDDPAAELDRDAIVRLMRCVERLGSQVVATVLDPSQPLFTGTTPMFHVEHGVIQRVS